MPYRSIILAGIFIGFFIVSVITTEIMFLKTDSISDFSTYWAAGHLNIFGGNPYSNEDMVLIFRRIIPGFESSFQMIMFYPPWIFPFIMPFGILSHAISRTLWLGLNTLVVIFCADRAWVLFLGPNKQRWMSWFLAIITMQTFYSLVIGNITALVLLGIVGFLYNIQNTRKDLLSGVFVALCMIKPHVVYLVLIAMLLWGFEHKRWLIFLGFGLTLLILTGISVVINPMVISQYLSAAGRYTHIDYASPVIGAFLRRFLFGWDQSWPQYAAPLAGSIWFLLYWRKHHSKWQWLEEIPVLLLLSIITAAFAWSHDQVVLVLVVIQVFIWLIFSKHEYRAVLMVLIYLAMQVIYIFTIVRGDYLAIWIAPALLLWYYVNRKMEKQDALLTNNRAIPIS